ncbi:spermidine/putrescine ABC transporter ATP-binding protein [Laceyella sacchari]|uniref:NitT/TauT family transport system ATP-binding protein n=1 Tax=Laceyella tengchongensis TaxID=574699 RepID=A0AA45WKF4_9BACL|nr:ABC transporter ATP-binding protein [Laceyella tengchongensis]AUS08402.1 spermidine/putrescine ABC transporter ATP-binding protein [Laceyella sacchari]MRG26820.1 ATP-binding cassette domain-containing protein [Laceyella tengchongensis]SMP06978.1 NitT/TauT family transport system ATP-binding protein [Laceyella tengchongensis]
MASDYAVQIEDLTHTYFTKTEEVTAIRSLSLTVHPGEFVVLVGPSGCGKSTILSLIAGLIIPASGRIQLFGNPVNGPSPRIAYMLQKDGLLAWRTVAQNMILGLELRRQATAAAIADTHRLLDEMGLSHVAHHYPHQLSGGMRQRVALVRTLAVRPDLLLLDEPFSALDIQNKIHLEHLLTNVLKEQQKTAILVTHDLEEAIAIGDRVLVIGGRPGQIRYTLPIPTDIRALPPLEARAHPSFRSLFSELWREVNRIEKLA